VAEKHQARVVPHVGVRQEDAGGRIRHAAEMGDITALMAIAEDIGTRSDSCMTLSKKINQMIEDFDLEGIQHLAGELDAC
jgi:hypothetical protein